jgi:prepilin-type N-terminal cleavage/methylation domain-containing protein
LKSTFRAHSNRARSAFTLVELLVVIGIIAILAAIITPAVMRAQATARNAAIKAEIDMLHMAIMNYKNEYGSFPPCISGTAISDPAAKHILRIFPRTASIANEIAFVTPLNSLGWWLGGYSDDPTRPVSGTNRKKLYDFDRSRLDSTQTIYYPAGKPSSPYIYINSSVYSSATWPTSAVSYTVGSNTYSIAANTYAPRIRTGSEYFNPDTFQILCAGRDEQFGTDDDLSNFWPGTYRDYQDSLKQ